MDLNLVVLAGKLATAPELRIFDSGSRLARYLVTVRTEQPRRRVDVIPVSLWDPPEELLAAEPHPGRRVWVAGTVQRRFWAAPDGRRSRLEVIADQVCLRDEADEVEEETATAGAG
ncbi:MAG: single-stranded DNA-binding protein [Gemmatimonadales bacterium]